MDKKISALDSVTLLNTGDVLPIVNELTTKKVTVSQIIDGLSTTAYVNSQDALKVDKIVGKGLSTEDYTTTEKTKLSGIAEGAEVNVNADWNAVSGDAQILNKPTIPTAVTQTSQLTNNGADGVNPFITALDIPVAGQASTLVREVKNMTGATLTKGTVVYISGANGNKALVSKALATTDALSSRTFGMLQSDILNNGLGNCVIIGDLTGLNTSTFAEGDQLYLSGVTAGTYTASKILAPTHLVYVGKVTRSHPTLGQIEVGIQNGYELEEIHDVAISGLANNDLLQYELSTDLWKNKTLASAGIQPTITLTTTGTSGASTLVGATLNIPQYSGGGSSTQSAFTILANKTNATALPTEQVYKEVAEQSLSGTGMIATGGTLPSGTQTHSYRWSQIGNLVTVRINLQFGTAGTCSGIAIPFANMSDIPQIPQHPTIYATALDVINYGSGQLSNTKTFPIFTTAGGQSAIRIKTIGSPNTYEFLVGRISSLYSSGWINIQYYI